MPVIIISAIEATGRSPRARRLRFDGCDPRPTSAAVVKVLGLEVGDAWDEAALEVALAEAEAEQAKERAYRMLGYRERSEHELLRGLLDDAYPATIAQAVVSRLAELGLVDDTRFASIWVRSRVHAGYDRRRIRRQLEQRGVAPEVIEDALEEDAPAAEELQRARASLRGKRATDRSGREKLIRRLVTRGFDLRTAVAAVDADAGETDCDGPPGE